MAANRPIVLREDGRHSVVRVAPHLVRRVRIVQLKTSSPLVYDFHFAQRPAIGSFNSLLLFREMPNFTVAERDYQHSCLTEELPTNFLTVLKKLDEETEVSDSKLK